MRSYVSKALLATLCITFVLFLQFKDTEFSFTGQLDPILFGRRVFHSTIRQVSNALTRRVDSSTKSINVLAYSVFGVKAMEKYGQFIKYVAKEAANSSLYKSWQVWIYHEDTMNEHFIESVNAINSAVHFLDVRNSELIQNKNAMIWRFLPVGNFTVDVACSRDLDSPLSLREVAAVTDWLKSNETVHVMRDNPVHGSAFMGGLWCFRNHKNRELGRRVVELVLRYAQNRNSKLHIEATKGDDQNVLNDYIWPLVKTDVMHHDSYLCNNYEHSIPFPTKRLENYEFVGCVRPCTNLKLPECPLRCRPEQNKDWKFC